QNHNGPLWELDLIACNPFWQSFLRAESSVAYIKGTTKILVMKTIMTLRGPSP
ncbi:hypothetical protein LINPERHAP2_LOCUS16074, partial [Linum perenne]